MPGLFSRIKNLTGGKSVAPTKPCQLSNGALCPKFVALGGHDSNGRSNILCLVGATTGVFGEVTVGEAGKCLAERNKKLETAPPDS